MKPKTITVAALLALAATSGQAQTLIQSGHVDIGVGFEDGMFDLHIHDETNDIEYSPPTGPNGAILGLPPSSLTSIPADPKFDFLGTAGEPLWVLPNTQRADLIFLGFAAEEIEKGIFVGDSVRFHLRNVSGPGQFTVYDFDSFGDPKVVMNTRDGISQADGFNTPAGGHADLNWAFSAPGNYAVELSVSGTLVEGGQFLESPVVSYTFAVVPEPGTIALLSLGGVALLLSRRGKR